MPKENVRKHLLKARDLIKSAKDEIEEALAELEEEDEEESDDNDTGFGFIGKDGIERVSDEENYEEAEDDD